MSLSAWRSGPHPAHSCAAAAARKHESCNADKWSHNMLHLLSHDLQQAIMVQHMLSFRGKAHGSLALVSRAFAAVARLESTWRTVCRHILGHDHVNMSCKTLLQALWRVAGLPCGAFNHPDDTIRIWPNDAIRVVDHAHVAQWNGEDSLLHISTVGGDTTVATLAPGRLVKMVCADTSTGVVYVASVAQESDQSTVQLHAYRDPTFTWWASIRIGCHPHAMCAVPGRGLVVSYYDVPHGDEASRIGVGPMLLVGPGRRLWCVDELHWGGRLEATRDIVAYNHIPLKVTVLSAATGARLATFSEGRPRAMLIVGEYLVLGMRSEFDHSRGWTEAWGFNAEARATRKIFETHWEEIGDLRACGPAHYAVFLPQDHPTRMEIHDVLSGDLVHVVRHIDLRRHVCFLSRHLAFVCRWRMELPCVVGI